ncbi:hypothetical protein PILCRDRAFT_7633 [Piloderma croceum F 1598]|uniref:DNA 3'-5' helicase n=1 Tax=Piloderma croceum (strain F 1598) TaxID=765440 RepID=A0A0C3BZC8_PILCF|nr:hypothetical protein PILCRDRAFT_7633 [Piloderma croceum F 1598]
MSENNPPPVWPPPRHRNKPPPTPRRNLSQAAVSPARNILSPGPPSIFTAATTTPQHLLTSTTNISKKSTTYRNGYEVKPQTPSYKPYALNSRGHKRQRPFSFDDVSGDPIIVPMQPLSQEKWNAEAKASCWLPEGCELRPFQTECADIVIGQAGDACVIAPTGSGKSLLWVLPLLAQKRGISLVITPFTSLVVESETRTNDIDIPSAFIYSENKDVRVLENTARGDYRIIYICVEMLEGSSFAEVLHSETFQRLLLAIFIDEAHTVHESASWRPAYT